MQHHTWKVTFDGGFGRVPVTDKMKNVLDVGTGTGALHFALIGLAIELTKPSGIWATEFAEAFPQTQVIGTDLSPIQPNFVPSNCRFIIDNAEHDWAFEQSFDYIHSRMVSYSPSSQGVT